MEEQARVLLARKLGSKSEAKKDETASKISTAPNSHFKADNYGYLMRVDWT